MQEQSCPCRRAWSVDWSWSRRKITNHDWPSGIRENPGTGGHYEGTDSAPIFKPQSLARWDFVLSTNQKGITPLDTQLCPRWSTGQGDGDDGGEQLNVNAFQDSWGKVYWAKGRGGSMDGGQDVWLSLSREWRSKSVPCYFKLLKYYNQGHLFCARTQELLSLALLIWFL